MLIKHKLTLSSSQTHHHIGGHYSWDDRVFKAGKAELVITNRQF